MSPAAAAHPADDAGDGRRARISEWLGPRRSERPGSGSVRLVETTLLVLIAIVLAVATVYDVGRQAKINVRLNADWNTWRAYTGHRYRGLEIDQQLLGLTTEREVVCGNTSPGKLRQRTQLCLVIWGPVHKAMRTVHGGWYLPPKSPDIPRKRYGCFGYYPSDSCKR